MLLKGAKEKQLVKREKLGDRRKKIVQKMSTSASKQQYWDV